MDLHCDVRRTAGSKLIHRLWIQPLQRHDKLPVVISYGTYDNRS